MRTVATFHVLLAGLLLLCACDDSDTAPAPTSSGGSAGQAGAGGQGAAGAAGGAGGASSGGVLRVSPDNPRFFTDDTGAAIFLTGSHTWMNLQDFKAGGFSDFDWDVYLDFLQGHDHNFIRLWMIEYEHDLDGDVWAAPSPYQRTGPGDAYDGQPRYDLTLYHDAFFDRLRSRILTAQARGIYVSVMLFSSFAAGYSDADQVAAWSSHPYHADNNVNGIDADGNNDGRGSELHTLADPAVTALQEALVRRVVDEINDLDNVLYEIGNEMVVESVAFQVHMIDLIHDHEATKPKQHPVGMTTGGPTIDGGWQNMTPDDLLTSPAEWISPSDTWGDVPDDPPETDGTKVVILDTDHIPRPEHGDWVWKALCRGYHPILMDVLQVPYPYAVGDSWNDPDNPLPRRVETRSEMGYAWQYAQLMGLSHMVPSSSLSSTGYCVANPGTEYFVYQPGTGSFTVDLSAASSPLSLEWFDPHTGETRDGSSVDGGTVQTLDLPSGWDGDVVAYLH